MKKLIFGICLLLFTVLSASIQKTNTDSVNKRFLTADATFELDLVNCKTVLKLVDETVFYDSSNADTLDFIISWNFDWGDGGQIAKIEREKSTDFHLKDYSVAHSYSKRGNFIFKYYIQTKKGLKDTFVSNIFIPGPQPSFKFDSTNATTIEVGVGECVRFINTTKNMTSSATFNFFFGDGRFITNHFNPLFGLRNPEHCYTKAGTYYTSVILIDSVNYKQIRSGVCPVSWPDTSYQPSMIVKVIEGLKTKKERVKYGIFPNPAHSWILIPRYKQNKIRIYNLLGEEQRTIIRENEGFNITQLKPGIYFICDNKNQFIAKFIKS